MSSDLNEKQINSHNVDHKPSPVATTQIQTSSQQRSHDSAIAVAPSDHASVQGDGFLERIPTIRDDQPRDPAVRTATTASASGPVHSVFTKNQKLFIVFMTSWAGFFSPVSGQIYFPALNSLAHDLHVSATLINLTLTSYMIFQGLAPAFFGDLTDTTGRRVAYFVMFTIYIGANIGLALQDTYAALFVLRCLQSTGSSATIAMASGVVADIATPAERGAYMGFTFAGSLLGPAIGPVIGGVLSEFLGWRAIFWFLTIMAGAFLLVFSVFFPETARSQVGNGSIPPRGLNMSLMNYLAIRKARKDPNTNLVHEQSESERSRPPRKPFRFPNPLASMYIVLEKEIAFLLFHNALLFASFYDVTAAIPTQFAQIYGFNDLQIGLCYIPFGCGSMLAALTNGQLLDRNFARWCRKLGVAIKKGRNQDLRDFPIEKVRLQIGIPAMYVACLLVLVFGWLMDISAPLAPMLVVLFLASFSMSIAFNCTSTLLVDFYPKQPATATAANNLTRCLLGAGATAVILPMINAMGRGWTFTFLSLFLIASSPTVWTVYFKGMKWREQRRVRDEAKQVERENRRGGAAEEAGGMKIDEKDEKGTDVPPVVGGIMEEATLQENVEEKEEVHAAPSLEARNQPG